MDTMTGLPQTMEREAPLSSGDQKAGEGGAGVNTGMSLWNEMAQTMQPTATTNSSESGGQTNVSVGDLKKAFGDFGDQDVVDSMRGEWKMSPGEVGDEEGQQSPNDSLATQPDDEGVMVNQQTSVDEGDEENKAETEREALLQKINELGQVIDGKFDLERIKELMGGVSREQLAHYLGGQQKSFFEFFSEELRDGRMKRETLPLLLIIQLLIEWKNSLQIAVKEVVK